MEFLGIGYQELLLVLGLLLVVVGPERLPTMAYQIGRAVRQMQGYARAVRDEFRDEIDYIDEQYKTVRGQVDEAQRAMRIEQRKMNDEFRTDTSETEGILPSGPLLPPLPEAPVVSEPAPAPVAADPSKPPMVF